jgi:hypothetical protein
MLGLFATAEEAMSQLSNAKSDAQPEVREIAGEAIMALSEVR